MAAAQYYEQVQEAYLAYYGRPADPAGLAYWAAQLNAVDGNMSAIINAFGNSAESTALYGGSSVAAQVNAIYETLFGRQADVAGLNYYVNGINNGTFSLASVALNIYNGAQGSDATELAAKLAYADAFTSAVGQSVAAQVGYAGTVAANTARAAVSGVTDANSEASAIASLSTTLTTIEIGPAVTLTAGADNVTGSNIVGSLTPYAVDGVGPTLNYNDVITGTNGSTNNTLTLNDDYAEGTDVIPLGANISNIQNVVLQTQGNAGNGDATSFDTSGIAGVQNVTVTSAGSNEDFVQAAATTTINVTHQNSEGGVLVYGGDNVNVTSNGVGVQIGSTSVANVNPAGAVTVTETGTDASVSVYGGTSVNVNDSGLDGNIQVGALGTVASPAQPTGAVTVNATGSGTSVEVFGGTDVTVNTVGSAYGITGDVTIGAIGSNEQVYAPTGNVAVSVNEATAYQYDTATSVTSGYESDVSILGGANISVTTNAGDVTIGGDTLNGSMLIAGQNPTGSVTVTDTSNLGSVEVYGGTSVTVNSVGDADVCGPAVVIGAIAENGQVVAPTGNVTVNVNQAVAFEYDYTTETTSGFESDVAILGGASVTVTTNAGDVVIGGDVPNGADTGALAGQDPSGNVKVTDTSDLGNVEVYGGANVTVNASGGYVQVGAFDYNEGNSYVTTPTGTVTITDTSPLTGADYGGVRVLGGTDINVTTNVGDVKIGTYSGFAGTEPTGSVHVTDTSGGNVGVYGGTDVTVATSGGFVQVGAVDYNDSDLVNAPSGTITVTDTAPADDTQPGGVEVVGGTDVSVTTDVGSVKVGTYSGIAGTEPSGTVNVTDTADGSVVVEGGTDVTVNAAGGAVRIGTGNATTDPSGNVSVTQSAVETGGWGEYKHGSSVDVAGGVNVTVDTTGGDVRVGTAATAVTGTVSIDDTFVGSNVDSFHVDGGTAVLITTTATSGDITVGGPNPADNLNSAGTGLANAADYASGNVTIVDESVAGTSAAGSSNVYGTGNVTVNTDGATSVSITGGSSVSVTDVETTAATGGPNIGQAIGTSTLATVSLDGVSGCATITSDALTSLTVADSARGAATDVTVINTIAQALTLTLDDDARGTIVTDATASTVTIDTTGADASHLVLNADYATSLTFDNAAAVTLDGADSSINDVVLITASGSGALALGDLSGDPGLALVDASTASGTVSVTLDPDSASFLGGTGNDTVTLDSAATGIHTIVGGSGDNTLVVNYDGTSEGALLSGDISNFQTLEIGSGGSGTFDVAGFTSLEVGHDSGAVTFKDVAAGTGLDITASPSGEIVYEVSNGTPTTALSLTLGTDNSSSTWSAPVTAIVKASGLDNIDIDSEGFAAAGTNQVTIGDSDAQTITITGTGSRSVSVTLATDSLDTQTSTVGGSDVTTINASGSTGAVNVTGVALAASGATIIGGAGVLTAQGVEVPASLDVAQQETLNITTVFGSLTSDVSVTVDGQTYSVATTSHETADEIAAALVTQIDSSTEVTATSDGSHIVLTADTAGIGFSSFVGSTDPAGVLITESPTVANGDAAAQLGSQAVDSITTGSGGGVITIGQGGSWVEGSGFSGVYGVGSETVNLSASTNVVDTIVVNDGAVSTFNGVAGGITGFQITANAQTSDQLTFGAAKTALANVTAPTYVSAVSDFSAAVAVLDPTGALKTVLANLTYTVSNGVITFSATGGHQLSDFTSAQLISAAEILVNSGAGQVAAFSTDGNTYVVTDDAGATLATGAGGNLDSITELVGVTGVTGFGSTAAANTIVATDVTNQLANSSNSGTASAAIYDETGFSYAALAGVGQTAGSVSTVFDNLAASAQLDFSATGDLGQVTTTQLGASGSNSLTLNFANEGSAVTVDTLTVTGDNALVIHTNVGPDLQATITSLVDATNTVASITVDGQSDLSIGNISDTALTTFDASALNGALTLTAAQNGLTIKGALGGDMIDASGTGDTITIGDATHSINGGALILAGGANDTITLTHEASCDVYGILATGNGDVISVDAGINYIGGSGTYPTLTSALGTGDTINLGSGGTDTVWVGSNSTVNIGSAHTALAGSADIMVTGDVTGTGSAGNYALTVINIHGANLPNAYGTLDLMFNNVSAESFAGGSAAASQVNVASATSLANALDIAATQAAILDSQHGAANTSVVNGVLEQNAGTGLVDYFQYGGNTYVVEAINSSGTAAAHTGLGAGDVVVELTGQVNIGANGCFVGGHQLQLTIGHLPPT